MGRADLFTLTLVLFLSWLSSCLIGQSRW